MSDGQRFDNPGNGSNGDLYRFSGTNRDLQGRSGNQGDLYNYDGSPQNLRTGNSPDSYDALQNYRSGQVRDTRDDQYPQTFVQREVRGDGTVIMNVVHCKTAHFRQNEVSGADYRQNPQQDYRGVDPDCARLRDRNQSSYYNADRSQYNGSYRQPEQYNTGIDYRAQQIAEVRQQQMIAQEMRRREIEAVHQRQLEMQYQRDQQIAMMSNGYRDCQQGVNIQMYNERCREANGFYPRPSMPYYANNGCFGNNGYSGYPDRYDSQYGGPCFGNNRGGISIRIPLGGHHGGGIRIGF